MSICQYIKLKDICQVYIKLCWGGHPLILPNLHNSVLRDHFFKYIFINYLTTLYMHEIYFGHISMYCKIIWIPQMKLFYKRNIRNLSLLLKIFWYQIGTHWNLKVVRCFSTLAETLGLRFEFNPWIQWVVKTQLILKVVFWPPRAQVHVQCTWTHMCKLRHTHSW